MVQRIEIYFSILQEKVLDNYAIRMKKVTFKTGLEVEDNDLCKVVLQKAEEK